MARMDLQLRLGAIAPFHASSLNIGMCEPHGYQSRFLQLTRIYLFPRNAPQVQINTSHVKENAPAPVGL